MELIVCLVVVVFLTVREGRQDTFAVDVGRVQYCTLSASVGRMHHDLNVVITDRLR